MYIWRRSEKVMRQKKGDHHVPLPLAHLNSDLRSDGKVRKSWQVKPNAEGLK